MKIKQFIRNRIGTIIIVSLMVLLFVMFFWDMIFVTIYPGHAGVLFRRAFPRGVVTDKVYPEGLTLIWPWNEMVIYDVRIREKKQTVNVLSQNGLTIRVIVSVRYYIDRDKAPILHQRVGPDYEAKIIRPVTISSVREVVGEYLPEQLYTTARHVIQDKMLIEVVDGTGRIPIVYDALIVENIKLPDLINTAIEAKLRHQQKYLEYQYRIQQAEAEITRKKKEAVGIRQYQNIVSESLSPDLLKWKGIMATLELAKSNNSKVVIVGGGEGGLPIILNTEGTLGPSAPLALPDVSPAPDPAPNPPPESDMKPTPEPAAVSGTDPGTRDLQGEQPGQGGPAPEPGTPAVDPEKSGKAP